MNINIAKYTLLAAAVSLAACKHDDDDGFVEQLPSQEEGTLTFATSFEKSLSKAALHIDGDNLATASSIQTYFLNTDALTIFDGVANNKFTTKDKGASVAFSGIAKASDNGYYALFPYNESATLNEDGTISTKIPEKQSYKSDALAGFSGVNSNLEGIVAVARINAGDNALTLKNATAIAGFHVINGTTTGLKIEANKPIAGDIKITFENNGTPTATGATSSVIELTDAPNGGFVSLVPVNNVNLKVTYTNKNDEKKVAYFNNVSFTRSEILDFGNLDELLSITYDVSGINGAHVENTTKKVNDKLTLPANIGDGITFTGWVDNQGVVRDGGEIITVTKDMSFVAVASNEKVLVLNHKGSTTFIKFKAGDPVTLPSTVDLTEGFYLVGWDASANTSTPTYKAGETATINFSSTTMTLNAIIDLKDIKVTLDANGGKFDDNKTTKEIIHKWGTEVTVTDEPTREGYWFKGWDTDHISPIDEVTVKAVWGNYAKIIYHDFDGNALPQYEQTYKDGGKATIRTDIKLGKLIASWNLKKDGSGTEEYIPGQEYKFNGDINLYPVKSNQQPSGIDDWTIKEF